MSEFMTLTITIHILTNISKSKGNQVVKFGQLIEHNMRNIFLEKSSTKCCGETISRSLSNKSKFNISLNQYSKAFNIFLCAMLCTIKIYRN